ncbi:DHS-like NAD/FAD-binding domain-containing protein [Gautieria morchelliformis]|nr:DHS-like NAD/FAD-binding domain-containing protein [Gautieria morchelliformis]
MPPSNSIEQFRSVLRKSKNIVAIAGAGLSSASGIPTFRGAGGLWRSHDAMSLATPQAFSKNPSRVWQFYHYRREMASKATPNAAHLALAILSLPEHLKVVAPEASFTLVTQNVDGLSAKAFRQACPSREPDLYEMHGHLFDTLCTVCGDRERNIGSPICPSLAGTEEMVGRELEIPLNDLPRCRHCAGLLRPGVVWFDEIPHHLKEIGQAVDNADLALVVGTSSTVYPAAGYAYDVAQHGGTVVVFNIQHTPGDEDAHFLFLGPCEKTLPHVLLGTDVPD